MGIKGFKTFFIPYFFFLHVAQYTDMSQTYIDKYYIHNCHTYRHQLGTEHISVMDTGLHRN